MKLCVLILSVFLAVTVMGCSDTANPTPTNPANPEPPWVPIPPVDTSPGPVEEPIVPDEVLPPEEDIEPDEVLPPEEDIEPDEVLPPEEDIEPDEVLPPEEGLGDFEALDQKQKDTFLVFGKGTRIIVQNTQGAGLRIRMPFGLDGDRIGGMFDGETGIILAEGEIKDKMVWFHIQWDPVKNPGSGCGNQDVCIGWSVAVTQDGTEVLNVKR